MRKKREKNSMEVSSRRTSSPSSPRHSRTWPEPGAIGVGRQLVCGGRRGDSHGGELPRVTPARIRPAAWWLGFRGERRGNQQHVEVRLRVGQGRPRAGHGRRWHEVQGRLCVGQRSGDAQVKAGNARVDGRRLLADAGRGHGEGCWPFFSERVDLPYTESVVLKIIF
jgi:hypothetical protein